MSNIFLISDPHWDMPSVIRFGERPFSDVSEMIESMVEKWNRTVKKRDIVICLGDWGRSSGGFKIADRLLGKKRLILGNHDKLQIPLYAKYFISIHSSFMKGEMILTHIPILFDRIHHYSVNVHGHIHNAKESPLGPYINVNMDAWSRTESYAPIPIEVVEAEVRKLMGKDTYQWM